MDRLARSLSDMLRIVEQLTARGIAVQFVKEDKSFEGSETADPMDKLMLSMLGACAEYERTLIRERQREGIAKAKERGVYRGRARRVDNSKSIAQIVAEATAASANKSRIAAKHGISRDALYKYLKSVGEQPIKI